MPQLNSHAQSARNFGPLTAGSNAAGLRTYAGRRGEGRGKEDVESTTPGVLARCRADF